MTVKDDTHCTLSSPAENVSVTCSTALADGAAAEVGTHE
jgi:hypothetical protein